MKRRYDKMFVLAGMTAMLLGGCSRGPETLAGTTWKVTGLTALDGTEYDEAAYDAIIGATIYEFDDQGNMRCTVRKEDTGIYRYVYEKGQLTISSQELNCTGIVKQDVMKLQLGEEGEAVLLRQ